VDPHPRRHMPMMVTCFASVYLMWGSTFLFNKMALQRIPPLLLCGFRFTLAGACLLAIVVAAGKGETGALRQWRYWRTAILTGALLFLLANSLLSGGLACPVPTGIAALIVGSTPITLVTMDRMQTRRGMPPLRVMLGMTMGLAGIVTLVGGSLMQPHPVVDTAGSRIGGSELIGALMILASTLFWGAGTILGRTRPQPRNPVIGSAMQMLAGGLMLLVASACVEPWRPVLEIPLADRTWLAVLFLVFGGSLTGFSAYMWLVRHTSAAAVATYAYVNPLVAMLLGWIFLGEQLHASTAVAALLILGGVVLMQLARKGHTGGHSPVHPVKKEANA
jgi:drug/metabolite transporter (DMT)-like permease